VCEHNVSSGFNDEPLSTSASVPFSVPVPLSVQCQPSSLIFDKTENNKSKSGIGVNLPVNDCSAVDAASIAVAAARSIESKVEKGGGESISTTAVHWTAEDPNLQPLSSEGASRNTQLAPPVVTNADTSKKKSNQQQRDKNLLSESTSSRLAFKLFVVDAAAQTRRLLVSLGVFQDDNSDNSDSNIEVLEGSDGNHSGAGEKVRSGILHSMDAAEVQNR